MEDEQRNVHELGPHWKRDPSFIKGPDSTGSFTIPVRALNITWGLDPRYWQPIELSEEETRSIGFKEAILLHQVNWIEATGRLDVPPLSSAMHTTYTLYFVVKFMPHAFGWHSAPIKFMLKINDTQEIMSTELKLETYKEKPDEWHEIPGGKSFTLVTSVEFGMLEVETDWWKGGMVLGGVKLKPDSHHHDIELK